MKNKDRVFRNSVMEEKQEGDSAIDECDGCPYADSCYDICIYSY